MTHVNALSNDDKGMRVDESALIGRVADGDGAAFEALYRVYVPRLRCFVGRVLKRRSLIDEVVNDTMLAVWREAGAYGGSAKVSTWIFSIAWRKASKTLRRANGAVDWQDSGERPCEPEGELGRLQMQEQVSRALARLTPKHRDVLRLVYFHGFGCREIAGLMGCPVQTVKTRAFHARRRLRHLLAGADARESIGQ